MSSCAGPSTHTSCKDGPLFLTYFLSAVQLGSAISKRSNPRYRQAKIMQRQVVGYWLTFHGMPASEMPHQPENAGTETTALRSNKRDPLRTPSLVDMQVGDIGT